MNQEQKDDKKYFNDDIDSNLKKLTFYFKGLVDDFSLEKIKITQVFFTYPKASASIGVIILLVAISIFSSNQSVDENGNTCIGNCEDGQGTLTYKSDGSVYVGEFRNGKKDGYGTITYNSVTRYSGQWKDDEFNGKGTHTWLDEEYVGDWKKGKKDGYGTDVYKNGSKYEGQWKDGFLNGLGTLTSLNGDKYVGEWSNGTYNGQGTYTFLNGNKYIGEWSNGKFNGQGTYIYINGYKYIGEFRDNYFEGNGTLFYPDGRRFEGRFINSNPVQGQGIMYLADGSRVDDSKIDWKMIIELGGIFLPLLL